MSASPVQRAGPTIVEDATPTSMMQMETMSQTSVHQEVRERERYREEERERERERERE